MTNNEQVPVEQEEYADAFLVEWRFDGEDMVPDDEMKENPLGASKLVPPLPPKVYGSHTHPWHGNREWVRVNGIGELPYRKPLDTKPATFEQAVAMVADEVNLTLETTQRQVSLPAQGGLFARDSGGRR